MNRAERRRIAKSKDKNDKVYTYMLTGKQIDQMKKEYINIGIDASFGWNLVVTASVLEDHFDFKKEDIAKFKEWYNLRADCLNDQLHTDLKIKDLQDQEEESLNLKTRFQTIKDMNLTEFEKFFRESIGQFIKLDKRKKIMDWLLEVVK